MEIVIRVDGGPKIGYGHLVRTGALARMVIERGHDVRCATTTPEVARSVYPNGADVLTLDDTTERQQFPGWIEEEQPDMVLTDSYEIDTAYQRSLRAVAPRLGVVLDDTRHGVCADMLVNGNVYATELNYDYEGIEPEWYLGLDYLLLREAIRTRAQREPPWRDQPERALLTMGGSDIRGTTPKVIPAFDGTDLTVDVIVGPGVDESTEQEIQQAIATTDADLRPTRDPPDLAERIFQADMAVSATGSTSYELLALGTPTIGIPQADNQVPIAETLADRGSMVHLPSPQLADLGDAVERLIEETEHRRALRKTGRRLVDGNGVKRVYQALAAGEGGET
jgi:UDP-2,4-diacetamido-2,4,6-trideoxy-beta-L-altropyranose hydrolase